MHPFSPPPMNYGQTYWAGDMPQLFLVSWTQSLRLAFLPPHLPHLVPHPIALSASKSIFAISINWLTIVLRLAGVACVVLAVMALLDEDSRGAHVMGSWRWHSMVLVTLAGVVALVSAIVDALSPPKKLVTGHSLRDLFSLLVLAIVGQILLSSDFKPFFCALCFGLAAGVYAGLRLLDRWGAGWRRHWGIRFLDLAGFQVCLLLVLLEISLVTVAAFAPSPLFARDASSVKAAMAMFRYPPGYLRYGFPCNSKSHYDEEFAPAKHTVVSIGDSFSMGVVPHAFHFSTVCERELTTELDDVAVHNLGHAGIGPGGYLWLLEHEGLALDPDVILVNLFIGNDLMESLRWNNPQGFFRAMCDRRNALSYQVPLRLMKSMQEEQAMRQAGQHYGLLQGESLLTEASGDQAALRAAMPWLDDPTLEEGNITAPEFMRIEQARARKVHDAEKHSAYPQLFTALTTIREKAAGKPLLIMLIPDQFQVDDQLWQSIAEKNQDLGMQRHLPQQKIAAWLQEQGIPHLDLLPVLRQVSPMADGQRHLYHLRDTHFNARGNQVVGKALAKFLREHLRKQ